MSEFVSSNGGWIAVIIAALFSGAATIVAARAKARSDRDAQRAPEWGAFSESQREMLVFMQNQIKHLGYQVLELQRNSEHIRDKYWKIVAWVRDVILRNPGILAKHPLHKSFKDDI